MRNLILLPFLCCFSNIINGQIPSLNSFISIDHIPIVVENIDSVKKILSETLHFNVKEGKQHLGIKNCFVKFQDGTYLEFITPTDSSQAIGNYYSNFLKNRQGGTTIAISVKSADTIMDFLKTQSIQFERDGNKIWQTVELKGFDLFFIDYQNKYWKDSRKNTTHFNQAISLKSTYIVDSDLKQYRKKYKALGLIEGKKGFIMGMPYKTILVGESKLCLLEASKASRITSRFNTQKFSGISGFEVKVNSLKGMMSLIPKSKNTFFEKGKIIYFFPESHFFIEFAEI